MLRIRLRTQGDLEECVACITRVYEKDHYPVQGVADAKDFLSGPAIQQAWIAEDENNTIKGHIAASKAEDSDVSVALWWQKHPNAKIAVLERLFVDPDCRGSGVAARLIAEAVGWANDNSTRLVLFALEKDRDAARLYERLGWTYFGTSVYHYGDGQQMGALCFVSPEPSKLRA